MKCQLARMLPHVETELKYHGLLVWAVLKKPFETEGEDIDSRRRYHCLDTVDLCLIGPYGRTVATAQHKVELLPYFTDCEPQSYETWLARGGEKLPEEDPC